MAKVQHYRGLDTDFENLYNSIRAEIANENNLQIVSEYKGTWMASLCEAL